MASPTLAPEIWTRIFHYVSPTRVDIANSRLVCKSFNTAASEFLITQIVLARRADVLQHALEILEHPFFRLHVTELVYDASFYREILTSDFDTYRRVCYRDATRDVVYRDSTRHLYNGYQGQQDLLGRLSQRLRDMQNVGLSRARCLSKKGEDLRAHTGFIEYSRRWVEQEQIVNSCLDLATFQAALTRLPKLRWIHYTDFRHLAKKHEPYLEFVYRLFGNVVEPSITDFTRTESMVELLSILSILKNTPGASIRGLRFGGHAYESLTTRADPERLDVQYTHVWNQPAGLPHDFLSDQAKLLAKNEKSRFFGSDVYQVPGLAIDWAAGLDSVLELESLRHLRLPVRIPLIDAMDHGFVSLTDVPDSNLKHSLGSSGNHLVSLELCAVQADLLREEEAKKGVKVNRHYLIALVQDLELAHLKHLVLQNWALPSQSVLKKFFSQHASTLREVRLLECCIVRDLDLVQFGRWVGRHMSLTGVELDLHPDSDMETLLKPDPDSDSDDDSDDISDDGFDDDSSAASDLRDESPQPRQHWDMTELQNLWLSGRPNCLKPHIAESYPFKATREELFGPQRPLSD
ncbi:hypothetical protein PRZ48_012341 [Zasmidium cellare]|uniref:F-box domain-containing protein n=1 Tax=Zasmidium cellare TaxID=395010 RepID=A0ABR0E563_ZASCE|nr:hypothetical protein PRZ48_012341 [Zasmidium cellare]